ncbi:MAG: DotA/TraY family protein, partial [Rhodocyclaceae bacterium]|nr:DotA/TraY family protein [Rhodocyclaceae bacterium]
MDLRPPDGDLSIEMLKMVFGSVFQQIAGGTGAVTSTSPDMLGTAFGVFNSAVLFFGSIIMTWVTVFGITNTAHDGEVLGKRWNTLYTPLRMTTASAVLIPGSTGYSGIQVILLWVVYGSIAFASSMWSKVVDYVVVDLPSDEIVSSVLPNRNLDTVGLSITKMMVCKRGVEQAIDTVMAGSGTKLNLQLVVLDGLAGYASVTTPNASSYVHVIGLYDPAWPAASGICGTLTIGTQITSTPPSAKTGLTANDSAMASATYNGMMTALSNVETNTDVSTAVTSLQRNIAALQMSYVCGTGGGVPGSSCQGASSALAPAIAKIITAAETDEAKDGPKPVSAATVTAAVQAFSQAFRQSLLTIVQGQVSVLNGAVADKLKRGGWANAGAVEREIARIKDAIRISSATQVSFSPGANSVICQDSCHGVQAAIFRSLFFCRTGLSQTVAGRSQFRVGPRQ